MHIAFLTPEYPHAQVTHAAGIGTSIKNLTTALVTEGIAVTVFVYGQKNQEIINEYGISIHLIKNKQYNFSGWYFHRKYIENYCNSIIKKEKIDLIEAPDWTGITAFMKFKIPLIIRFHGSDTYFCHLEKRPQKIKNFWFEKLAVSAADAFIAPTSFAGELSKQLFKIKNKIIRTIHHGLDLTQFDNKTPAQFETGLILYVGTIIRKKGLFELPAIFTAVRQKNPNIQLVLIGNDAADIQTHSSSTWNLVAALFSEADIQHVSYLGKKPYAAVQEYIKKAHVCVFPSFAETLGMVTIEAMAMQKAVVNSDIGWSKELITDGESGFLVHPTDHQLYADKIMELLQNNSLCQQTGTHARTRAEAKFDIKHIVKENIEFYQQMINKE